MWTDPKTVFRIGFLIVAAGLIVFLYQAIRGVPISEYETQDRDEKMILSLFLDFAQARNTRDVERFLSTFHEDARYMIEPGFMATKKELRALLPGLWDKGADGCITWECIDENCFSHWSLANPEFFLGQNQARVEMLIKAGIYRGPLYVDLVKDQNQWFITELTRPRN